MAQYWEDWSGSTLSQAPTGWSLSLWGSDFSLFEVQEDVDGPAGRRLRWNHTGSTKRTFMSHDAASADSERVDFKIRALMRLSGNASTLAIHSGPAGRGAGSNNNETAYVGAFAQETSSGREIWSHRYNGGNSSSVHRSSNTSLWTVNNLFWLKLDVIGDQVTVAIAPFGDELNNTYSNTSTNTDISGAGDLGLFSFSTSQGNTDVLAVAIATGEDDAFYSDPQGGDPDAPTNSPVIQTPIGTTSSTATVEYTFDEGGNNGDPATGFDYRLDGTIQVVDIGNPDPKEFEITGLDSDTQYSVEVRAYNAGGEGPWSASESFTTDEGLPTLSIDGDFDAGNLDGANSSVTDAGATEPHVTIQPRKQSTTSQSNTWQNFFFRIDNADGRRPTFDCLNMDDRSDGQGGDNRPWYSYDLEQWFRPNITASVSSNVLSWQWDSAFTQNTVYVSYQAAYQVAAGKRLIDWIVANHPDRIHRLPSTGDDADWNTGNVAGQTDDLGRSIDPQPMRSFGIWDSTAYPDDGLPKRTVLFTAGIHAGEHDGDWVFDSCVRYIVSSNDAAAVAMRKNFQFVIYPCINPVGRWGGHFRGQWDTQNLTQDPNRDWGPRELDSSQVLEAAFNKDFAGRSLFLHYDFHAWTNTSGHFFSFGINSAPSAARSLFDTEMTSLGLDDHRSEAGSTHLRRWTLENFGADHTYALEVVERGSHDQALLTTNGELWAQGIDAVFQNDGANGFADFEGKYLALDFTGTGSNSAGPMDMVAYDSVGGALEKEERGLGVDSEGRWRADMNAVSSADVFVVVSDDAYVTPDNTRSHARRYTPEDTNG